MVLTVEGDVDVATASVLRRAVDEALAEAGPHPLVIDLTGVTFLASRGLSTLVEAHREASASSPLRVVVDHTRPVIRPLQLSGLDRILTLFHDVEDALSGRPGSTSPSDEQHVKAPVGPGHTQTAHWPLCRPPATSTQSDGGR